VNIKRRFSSLVYGLFHRLKFQANVSAEDECDLLATVTQREYQQSCVVASCPITTQRRTDALSVATAAAAAAAVTRHRFSSSDTAQ